LRRPASAWGGPQGRLGAGDVINTLSVTTFAVPASPGARGEGRRCRSRGGEIRRGEARASEIHRGEIRGAEVHRGEGSTPQMTKAADPMTTRPPRESISRITRDLGASIRLLLSLVGILWMVSAVNWLAFGGRLNRSGAAPDR
jgi:hypothetical protein